MADSYLGEIRLFSFAAPIPQGWLPCSGGLLPIDQFKELFSLLGNRFGGDGKTNFALPDLRGRVPLHAGNGYVLGKAGGQKEHKLTGAQIPEHNHTLQAVNTPGNSVGAPGDILANAGSDLYAPVGNLVPMNPNAVTTTGGNQPHPNMQPYLVLGFYISVTGLYPTNS